MNEYISREAAKEALYKTAEEYDEYDKCDRIAIIALNNADEILNDIPAADVVEVRHGRWKKSYADHEAFGVRPFFRYCSECHEATVHQYNYCPNCGAKMDGGQDDV